MRFLWATFLDDLDVEETSRARNEAKIRRGTSPRFGFNRSEARRGLIFKILDEARRGEARSGRGEAKRGEQRRLD